jgi:hypothetical protein
MSVLRYIFLFFFLGLPLFAEEDLVKKENIYPFLVTTSDLEDLKGSPTGAIYELGHNIYVTLVYDTNGSVRNLVTNDLESLNLSIAEAHQFALDNLANLAETDLIKKRLIKGPDDQLIMVWGGHWLSATCVLLPNLNSWFKSEMNIPVILGSVPRRGLLYLFPKGDKFSQEKMRNFVAQNESKFDDLLTLEFYELSDAGIEPFYR